MLGFCVFIEPSHYFSLFSLFLYCLLGPDYRYLYVRVNVCFFSFVLAKVLGEHGMYGLSIKGGWGQCYLSKFNFLILGSLESGRTSVPPLGSQLITTRIPMGTHNTELILRLFLEAMGLCSITYPQIILCPWRPGICSGWMVSR